MYEIEPHASWLPLAQAAQAETDPRRRTLLQAVCDHMEAEITGNMDALMATLTSEPIYHFWGRGEPMVLEGRDTIRGFYSQMMSAGGEQFEVVVQRIVAGNDQVVTEGQVKQVYTAEAVRAGGVTEVNGVAVADGSLWLSNAQLVTVWPADADGKLIGEDIYFGEDPLATLTPIAREALPPYYRLAA
ncbi:MAG: nuclear transport factor 2 family protein [Pseudomonadales bacterium]